MTPTCTVPGCTTHQSQVGLCHKHYARLRRHGDVNVTLRDTGPPMQRIQRRVAVDSSGCWLWTGTIDKAGYGRLSVGGRAWLAHRLSYELHVGPIPDGLELDHLCAVRGCVNPEHLEPVTPQENKRRMLAAAITERTHCPQGHPYAGDNLFYEAGSTSRRCRTCRDTQREERNQRRRSA